MFTLRRIKVTNFKSFKNLDVELKKVNILIGKNASGKSNFVDIFRFLRDIVLYGLKNAISLQGGIQFLRNINLGNNKKITVELTLRVIEEKAPAISFVVPKDKRNNNEEFMFVPRGIVKYSFELEFINEPFSRYKVTKETFETHGIISKIEVEEEAEFFEKYVEPEEKLASSNKKEDIILLIKKTDEQIKLSLRTKNITLFEEVILHNKKKDIGDYLLIEPNMITNLLSFASFAHEKIYQNFLIISASSIFSDLTGYLKNIGIYDFDPKRLKPAAMFTGKIQLESDGRNLAIVLKNILEDKRQKERFFLYLRDLLPFIRTVDIKRLPDKSLLPLVKEVYTENQFIPAPLISDGTVNIIALIIALYFENNSLTIVEEPEKNIHPQLISKIIDMMKDVTDSYKKQVIATTHNPVLVKNAGIDNLLLISRDDDGFSRVSRPKDREAVKVFLQHEVGLDELYIQDLLD